MSEDRETNENEDLLDADVGAAISEIIENGDLSRLSTEERVRYVAKVCKDLKISPMTMPLQFLRLQGKLVLYVTRAATDQLAANARLTREIVDGPRVMDFAGTKMLYAVCRVTHPNGRAETATATVPLNDPLNGIMKVETKAKRRATLAILGLAMLDPEESQLAEEGRELAYASPASSEKRDGSNSKGPLLSFIESLSQVSAPMEAVGHWLLWRDRISVLADADRKRAWLEICKRVTSVGGVSDASTWLMKAVNEENACRAAAVAEPPSSPVTSSAKASSLSSSDQEHLDEMSVRLAGLRTAQADAETCARELYRMASESRLSEQAADAVSVIAKNYLCLREYQRLVSKASLTDGSSSGGSTSSNEDSGVVGLRDLVESMSRGGQGDVIEGLKFPSAAQGNNDDPLSAESSGPPSAPAVDVPAPADKKTLPEDPRLQNLRKMLNACVSIKSLTGMVAVWRSCAKGLPSNLRGAGFVMLKKAMGLFDPSIDESKIAVFVKNDEKDPVELAKERDFCSPVDLPLWQAYLLKAERDGAVSGSYAKRHEKLRAAHGNGELFESFRTAAVTRIMELRTCSESEASTLISDVVRHAEKHR